MICVQYYDIDFLFIILYNLMCSNKNFKNRGLIMSIVAAGGVAQKKDHFNEILIDDVFKSIVIKVIEMRHIFTFSLPLVCKRWNNVVMKSHEYINFKMSLSDIGFIPRSRKAATIAWQGAQERENKFTNNQ